MSIGKTVFTMAVLATALVLVAGALQATPPRSSRLFDWKLEPLEPPKAPGVIEMLFEFTPTKLCSIKGCTETEIRVITKGGLSFLGPQSWKQQVKYGETYSQVIRVNIPPNDTCRLKIRIGDQFGGRVNAYAWFVTFTDSVEFWKGYPRRSLGGPGHGEQMRARMSSETLREVVTVRLSLTNKHRLIVARLNELVPEMDPTDEPGVFTADVTRDVWLSLISLAGVNCEIIDQPPPPQPDSSLPPGKTIDSVGKQGLLDDLRKIRGDGAFWIDGAYPLTAEGKLPTGQDVIFYIYALNNTNYNIAGISNGFKVYSPEGANWDTTVGTAMSDHPWNSWFDLVFSIWPVSCDGSGADTIGFGGTALFGTGLPIGFDDTAYAITIGPISAIETGKTICVDSSFYPPVMSWKWAAGGGVDFYPVWGGPYCWSIGSTPITIRGNLYYRDPTPKASGPDTTLEPMRNIEIEMWDEDQSPLPDQKLKSIRADDTGYFEFNNISNVDEFETGGQDVYFIVKASNLVVSIIKDVAFTLHEWRTPVWNDVPGGIYDTVLVAAADSSGPFFVADAYLDAQDAWETLRPSSQFDLQDGIVALAKDSIQTGYNIGDDYIFINDSVDANNEWPDTWNRFTILHEFGHRIAHNFDFCDDTSGAPASHTVWEIHNLEFAALEGFAHWWSTVVDGAPMRTKYWANFTDSSWANFENGEYGNPALDGSFNARGPMCEGAVAGILWDIFDSNPDDYSERGDWGLTRLPHKADGIGDALSDGSDNILEALLNRTYGLERPDNIHEFYQTWFQSPDLGHCPEIYNIFYEHADSMHPPPKGCNCCQIRGNVDNFDQALDISDLIWLVDFMFCGGPPPPCWEQGNINGDTASEIDVSDLIYLVDYMFTQGPPPPPCL